MRRCVAALVACGLVVLVPASAGAGSASIKVRDDYFTPDFRILVPGDDALWFVEGFNGHTVTSYPDAPEPFDSSPLTTTTCTEDGGILGSTATDCLEQGDDWGPVEFDLVGTYDYYCKIHGDPSIDPVPSASAASQPCGMCGRILVKVPSSSRPATRHPTPEADPTQASEATPSASVTPSATEATNPQPSGSLVAGGSEAPGGGSGGLRALFAAVAIGLLTGLGALVWRRYFASA
jgi:plastocyanin